MLKNFDLLKKQLIDLAPIINSFKSESVQLKIVDLILSGTNIEKEIQETREKQKAPPKPKRRENTTSKPLADKTNSPKSKRKKGQMTLLNELIDEGYFSSRRSVNDIAKYCSVNKATTIKSKDYASALTRYIRDGKLKREKNESGQYEYYSE